MEAAIQKTMGGSESAWLWNSLGVAELNLKEYGGASVSFEKALKFFSRLSVSDWQSAYPGNDPRKAEEGLVSFHDAIQKNLEKSRVGQ